MIVRPPISPRAPAIVAAGILILAIAAAATIWRDGVARQRGRFEIAAMTAAELVRDRLQSQIALLHGGAGLFAAAPTVSCGQFGDFVERMQLAENYPGTQGMGFSIRTDRPGSMEIESAARAEGFSDFRVRPDSPRDEYHVIRCIEPLTPRNRMVLGYDMFTDPARREAMVRARDAGQPALSRRVRLVQEIDPQRPAGFLIYMPVYAGDDVPPDVESRRRALRGFVYSPLRGDDFLGGLFGAGAPLVNVEVYDGDHIHPEALLHRRGDWAPEHEDVITNAIDVAGRRWTLRFRPAASLVSSQTGSIVLGVLASGSLLALLLYLALMRAHRASTEAAEAEARARESSELAARGAHQLALMMDAVPALVSFIDADERYVIVNRRYEEWFGLPRARIEGQSVREMVGPETYAMVAPSIQEALAGRPASSEATLETADGRRRSVLASYMPHRDREGATLGVVGLLADITEQKAAQRALAESEANLRAILNASLDAVIQMDTSGRIVFWNPRAEDMFGWTSEEAIGRPVRDLIVPPALRDAHREGLERYLRTREAHILGRRIEVPAVRKNGSEIPVELAVTAISGRADLFSAFVSDLSERNRSLATRRFLTDAAIALSSSLDRERLIAMIAERALPHLGTGAAVITVSPGSPPAVTARAGALPENEAAALAGRLAEADPVPRLEDSLSLWPLVVGTHHMGWIALTGEPLQRGARDDEEAVAEEYTRRASMALHHAHLYEQAQVANRLKDDFLSTLSHELRTPANAILGWAQMARDGVMQGRDVARALDAVLRNARAQNDLIEDILDAQRLAAGRIHLELQELDLGTVIGGALDGVRPAAAAKHITMEAHLEETCPIAGDPDRLRQIFWNLLSNAVKFTPDSGVVRVECFPREGQAIARIVDTGPGIAPDFLPHVFERFRQGDPSTTKSVSGLGLGLAIAKNLTELHGGTISAANRDDGTTGAEFVVTLPIARRT